MTIPRFSLHLGAMVLIAWVLTAFALPALAEHRPIDQTANSLRDVVHDLDDRRSAHYRDDETELHRRALAAHRAMELSRGLLADYQAELRRTPQVDEVTFADDLLPIARWIVPPMAGTVDIEAYHVRGIDRIEGDVDGEAFVLRGDGRHSIEIPDREGVTVTATVYPVVGEPREMPTLRATGVRGGEAFVGIGGEGEAHHATIGDAARWLHRNGGASGATIWLAEGDHEYGVTQAHPRIETQDGWLTIRPMPDAVARITGNVAGRGLATEHVRFKDLVITNAPSAEGGEAKGYAATMWLDGCEAIGEGPTEHMNIGRPTSWRGGVYATNSTFRDMRNVALGWALARGCTMDNIGADAHHNTDVIIDSTVSNLVNVGLKEHRDIAQWNGTDYSNILISGLTATENISAQPLFSRRPGVSRDERDDGRMDNVAIVNTVVHSESYSPQWQQRTRHMFWRNVSLAGDTLLVRGDSGGSLPSDNHDWLFDDVVIPGLSWSSSASRDRIVFRNVRDEAGRPITLDD